MRTIRIDLTTNTAGAATAFGEAVVGTLYAVQLIDGDFADGVDITLTAERDDLSIALLTKANFNTDQIAYPRTLEHLNTSGADLATHCEPLVFGRPKAVIAEGGAVKTGAVVLYVREL
jgi:hypothetical protein